MKTDTSHHGSQPPLLPVERIDRMILLIRGQRVVLDADLAALYAVPTKAVNQAVKRNLHRFPSDFMFRLTPEEKAQILAGSPLGLQRARCNYGRHRTQLTASHCCQRVRSAGLRTTS
jgi:hypothetical protein